MEPRVALVCLLLVALPLAGCTGPGDGGDDDTLPPCERPGTLGTGDLARVRFVERFEDGHVHNASVPGDHPRNTTLASLGNASHREVWWLMWGGFVEAPEGDGSLSRMQLADLEADRVVESIATFRRDPGGGETVSLWNVPPNVTDPGDVPAEGVHAALTGQGVGDRVTNLTVPPEEGFGERDPNATITVPAKETDQPRLLENRSKRIVELKSNLTAETEVGDVISYELFEGGHVDARVETLESRRVSLFLLVEEGMTFSYRGWWNASIQRVDNATYDLRHHASVGQEVRDGGRVGRVAEVDDTSIVLDFNDPRAGHTMVYDLEVREIARLCERRDLRSHPVDPVAGDSRINDVAMIEQSMPTVATDRGAFFTASARWGEAWFSLAPELSDRPVRAIAASPAGDGTVVASVPGAGVLVSRDFGATWSEPAGDGLPEAPADVTIAGGDDGALYAVVDGEVLRSGDGGASWEGVGSAPSKTRAIEGGFASADRLWAATGEGVKRSDDGGTTWRDTGLKHRSIPDVSVIAEGFVFASTGFSLLVTLDGGDSWSTQGTVTASRIDALPRLARWIVAKTGPTGAGLSQDAGGTWLRILA